MGISKINSVGLMGIDGFLIEVQTDISNGYPGFEIIGLPDAAIKESKERVRTAVKNSGFNMPPRHITTNLAPASMKKEGTALDLPIAVSVLEASEQVVIENSGETAFIGELFLDGAVGSVSGVLPMVISAVKSGIKHIFVPKDNADEAAVVDGINVYPVTNLRQIQLHFSGNERISAHSVNSEDLFSTIATSMLDFADVKGQETAKRALELAAAGNHNILLIGSPGSGKTMLAQRMPTILPDLTFDEALEVTKIHSIAGILPKNTPVITQRPFRSPHHTVSSVSLSGGGSIPKPGELSLAHNGILFLDELPEFKREALEVLRQPLEDGVVTISRVNATLTYPCNIMLIASMNPCKCGYLGDDKHECTCTPASVAAYRSRISGPLLDRIDMQVEVNGVEYDKLNDYTRGETSAEIKKRVDRARKIQQERYHEYKIYSNSQLTAAMIEKYCRLGEAESALLKNAFDTLGFSARAYSRVLKVARTAADMDGCENIEAKHIAEAINYRRLDRNYFN